MPERPARPPFRNRSLKSDDIPCHAKRLALKLNMWHIYTSTCGKPLRVKRKTAFISLPPEQWVLLSFNRWFMQVSCQLGRCPFFNSGRQLVQQLSPSSQLDCPPPSTLILTGARPRVITSCSTFCFQSRPVCYHGPNGSEGRWRWCFFVSPTKPSDQCLHLCPLRFLPLTVWANWDGMRRWWHTAPLRCQWIHSLASALGWWTPKISDVLPWRRVARLSFSVTRRIASVTRGIAGDCSSILYNFLFWTQTSRTVLCR